MLIYYKQTDKVKKKPSR